jgi:hypothetical protein
MGDDIGFHNTVAGIVLCGQRVRVGRNVGPDISHLRALAVDHSLVIVDERVALPMRSAPQFAPGFTGRLEASEKPIALRIRVPPDRDEPA